MDILMVVRWRTSVNVTRMEEGHAMGLISAFIRT